MTALSEQALEAAVAAEIAYMESQVAKWRVVFEDGRLTAEDIASILHCADVFGVPQRIAYYRARDLGTLSYQAGGHHGA